MIFFVVLAFQLMIFLPYLDFSYIDFAKLEQPFEHYRFTVYRVEVCFACIILVVAVIILHFVLYVVPHVCIVI